MAIWALRRSSSSSSLGCQSGETSDLVVVTLFNRECEPHEQYFVDPHGDLWLVYWSWYPPMEVEARVWTKGASKIRFGLSTSGWCFYKARVLWLMGCWYFWGESEIVFDWEIERWRCCSLLCRSIIFRRFCIVSRPTLSMSLESYPALKLPPPRLSESTELLSLYSGPKWAFLLDVLLLVVDFFGRAIGCDISYFLYVQN